MLLPSSLNAIPVLEEMDLQGILQMACIFCWYKFATSFVLDEIFSNIIAFI